MSTVMKLRREQDVLNMVTNYVFFRAMDATSSSRPCFRELSIKKIYNTMFLKIGDNFSNSNRRTETLILCLKLTMIESVFLMYDII